MAVQEARWGRAGKQLKVCAFNTRYPRTRPRDNSEPSCAPHLSPGLQGGDAIPNPSAAATESGGHLLAGCPHAPSSGGPSLPKRMVLG